MTTLTRIHPAREPVPDHEQKKVALGYVHEAWAEARLDGVLLRQSDLGGALDGGHDQSGHGRDAWYVNGHSRVASVAPEERHTFAKVGSFAQDLSALELCGQASVPHIHTIH